MMERAEDKKAALISELEVATVSSEKTANELLEDTLMYLDDLRESGQTNMYGATSWVEAEFTLSKKLARAVLAYWMETFSAREAAKTMGE